ncbi:ATP-grasp domain-containing protein [Paucibacter sp. DJ1R-11]|uniref:ATP-grasp domain-containing protein n=1 Tax=Paucibacter sp. DJ1R-11 TaxID=2893556 RepID=UPI0021E50A64|nr:ATP-grasp domain-containing protein [Paucibacter sp. DJ1R-11]MCV2364655.1 ATP-grasp domain-containing protein [Paucibacter sp. DJ1R-11]
MRVLVTALGSMAAPFVVDSLHAMGHEVVGVDIHPRPWIAAAAQVDVFAQVPTLARADAYQQALLALCEAQHVQLVLPLTDPEVDELCTCAGAFASRGIKLAVPSLEAVRLLRDKLALHDHFSASALPVIPSFRAANYLALGGTFPCIAKPARGRSSEGQFVFRSRVDFERAAPLGESYIVQPFLEGDVVVVDVLRSGPAPALIVARRELLRTRNGAGLAVQILDADVTLQSHVDALCQAIDFEGCINVEFLQLSNGGLRLMDVNPRFSAGVAFSGLAGYNFVHNHVRHHLGQTPEPLGLIQGGAIYTRKYTEVIV